MTVEEIAAHTRIDPWFLDGLRRMVEAEDAFAGRDVAAITAEELRGGRSASASPTARSPRRMACDGGRRSATGAASSASLPVYKTIDTCAAEFEARDAVLLLDLRGGERVDPDGPPRRS